MSFWAPINTLSRNETQDLALGRDEIRAHARSVLVEVRAGGVGAQPDAEGSGGSCRPEARLPGHSA